MGRHENHLHKLASFGPARGERSGGGLQRIGGHLNALEFSPLRPNDPTSVNRFHCAQMTRPTTLAGSQQPNEGRAAVQR